MPGVSVTINEMIDALRQLGGPNLENHLKWKSDEKLQAIVDAWPHHFVSSFAVSKGIRPDASFASMLADFVKNQNISTAFCPARSPRFLPFPICLKRGSNWSRRGTGNARASEYFA